MYRKLQILFAFVLTTTISAYAQVGTGTLKGNILDDATGETLPFVSVKVMKGDRMQSGTSSDFDGKFQIANLPPGSYDVEFTFVGYQSKKVTGVVINADKIRFLKDVKMSESSLTIDEFVVEEYAVPLIDMDGGSSGGTVTKETIGKMATRSAAGVAATVGGVAQSEGGDLSVRGARFGSNQYYIDGIKVRGSISLPKDAIEEVQVITGGLPASYGDVSGGVIAITTSGSSSAYVGGIEYITSGYKFGDKVYGLDNYGYNLLEASLSGPLIRRKDSLGKKQEPIVGFLLTANANHNVDARPLFGGTYRITDDYRDYLIQNPLRVVDGATQYNASYTTENDVEKVKTRENASSLAATGVLKLDINTGKNTMLTFSGSGAYNQGNLYSYNGSLFNAPNFGKNQSLDWRASARFSHKFPVSMEKSKTSKFKGASYSVMADYSQTSSRSYDPLHKDNLFGYGHVGTFETEKINSYTWDANQGLYVQNGWRDVAVDFTASDLNPDLAAQTTQYYSLFSDPVGRYENFNQLQFGKALLNGSTPTSVYDIWTNVGGRFNSYAKSNTNQFRVSASGSLNIGDHRMTLGFEYEQRKDRNHSVAPVGLWTLARLLVNDHIGELDLRTELPTYNEGAFHYQDYNRLHSDYEFDTVSDAYVYQGRNNQFTFDYNLRKKLGLDPLGTDWIDVDALDPNTFSLDMFSADELMNNGNNYINYYGYNFDGSALDKRYSFNDFFTLTKTDETGDEVLVRPVNAYEPIYMAGYIMDKFSFEDIVFNVGLRVDRFDANQPVLKDQYLLAEANTAQDVRATGEFVIPESIGDDYVVYVDNIEDPTSINGYRKDNEWFNANGQPIVDPSLIAGSDGISPYLKNPNELDGTRLTSDNAFEDYKPQINVMPRVAFSFQISDEAAFSAHYDILTQRPVGNIFNPWSYMFIADVNNVITNPNLRAEKTIDYEVAFQQKLTKSSSLKIAAFYREQRDQIQIVSINQAYPATYLTYGNIDFGTVKGITVTYQMRRTKNISLNASYTLQFADGTGSGPTDGFNLASSGQPNLRTIFPYSYDQRHTINGTIDYRYGEGKDYNGPKWGEKIFQNMGVNLTGNLSSGTPFSRRGQVTPRALITGSQNGPLEGTKNGSRLPWRTRLDLRIDKDFTFKSGKDKKRALLLNVYVWVSNLLNSQNIISLYGATGTADDDGYLSSTQFQNQIEAQISEESFRYLYALKVDNPYNYGAPRTIRLGVKFGF